MFWCSLLSSFDCFSYSCNGRNQIIDGGRKGGNLTNAVIPSAILTDAGYLSDWAVFHHVNSPAISLRLFILVYSFEIIKKPIEHKAFHELF